MITLFVLLGKHFQCNVLDGRWSQGEWAVNDGVERGEGEAAGRVVEGACSGFPLVLNSFLFT